LSSSAFDEILRNQRIAVAAEVTELNFGAIFEYAVRNSKMSSSVHDSNRFWRVRMKQTNRWKCIE
jgi:hypothetical protein